MIAGTTVTAVATTLVATGTTIGITTTTATGDAAPCSRPRFGVSHVCGVVQPRTHESNARSSPGSPQRRRSRARPAFRPHLPAAVVARSGEDGVGDSVGAAAGAPDGRAIAGRVLARR